MVVLTADVINTFLDVLRSLRENSSKRLDASDEHAVDTVSTYLVNVGKSVKRDGELEGDDAYSAGWDQQYGGAPKHEKRQRGVAATGQEKTTLRVANGFHHGMRATWALDGQEDDHGAEIAEYIRNNITSWDFDIFVATELCGGNILREVTYYALEHYDLIERLEIPEDELLNFLEKVELAYHANPYHNSMHAADVLQSAVVMMEMDGIAEALTDLEILCVIIACCIHDVGHPGVNNDFLVKSGNKQAFIYKDKSVNENMHFHIALGILQDDECNFIEGFTLEEMRIFRDTIEDIVLKTDMVHHHDMVKEVTNECRALGITGPAVLDAYDEKWKMSVLAMIVHAADISNTCRQAQPAGEWARRVTEEFFGQGDQERKLGLNVGPLNNRMTGILSKSQLAFVTYVSVPLMECLGTLLPVFTETVRKHRDDNIAAWKQLIALGDSARFWTIGVDYSTAEGAAEMRTEEAREE